MIKHQNMTVLTFFIFIILVISISLGGCLEQNSRLSGEKGAIGDNKSSPKNDSNSGDSFNEIPLNESALKSWKIMVLW